MEEKKKKDKFNDILKSKKEYDEDRKMKTSKLQEIKDTFFQYACSDDKQKRAFWLEKVLYEILDLESIENRKPYKAKGEQIDGHLKFQLFDYLVEVKWTDEQFKQKDASIFE